ncbi:hypothetical protein ZIOFF_020629 [Zingiber officinale]|uniref:DUF7036 domain-containing protein n=1 Tax=Zingiber officinale TaxID=94328 RepID=A0A8J5LLG6_ZINOF|nr:hypothetical protein ZIOFF_020629 [Zingiber officinale]
MVTLIVALAMLLSVVFWLPPLLRTGDDAGRPDRDPRFPGEVFRSLDLRLFLVEALRLGCVGGSWLDFIASNIRELQLDIFDEIGIPGSTVSVIDLKPTSRSNWTNVVFSVWSYPKNSYLSSTGLSILRASFMSLVIGQSTLHLTTSLFGNSSSFEVLKFSGGIVIIPLQRAFLLQNVLMLFNFTLNFPINQIQDKFSELKDQMKAGLLLNTNEVCPRHFVLQAKFSKILVSDMLTSSFLTAESVCEAPAPAPADALKHLAVPVGAPRNSAGPVVVGRHSGHRPVSAPHFVGAPLSVPWHLLSPHARENIPVPAPSVKPSSQKSDVSITPVLPPSESVKDNKAPGLTPSISPIPYSSYASDDDPFPRLAFAPAAFTPGCDERQKVARKPDECKYMDKHSRQISSGQSH